jgi:hypothetical protein
MGWASGSSVMESIIEGIRKKVVDEKQRVEIYKVIIEALEDSDWDTQNECIGNDKAYDIALKELHPDWEI